MELKDIQNRLIEQIERDPQKKVLRSNIWCIPIHTYQVTYQPSKKSTMDILMKIILFSLEQSNFESAEELSEILLVEPLFIEDLLKKMLKNGLVQQLEDGYGLTEKGRKQLSLGIFEEQLDVTSVELLYSPVHDQFLLGDIEEVLDFDDFPEEMYRYYEQKEELSIPEERIRQHIQSASIGDEEKSGEEQIEIQSIESMEELQINDLPIIELVIQKNHELNIKAWNTLIDTWDEILENQLNQPNRLKEIEKIL